MKKTMKWERVMWKGGQGVADNFVDKKLKESVSSNKSFGLTNQSYLSILNNGAIPILIQFTVVVFQVIFFFHLYSEGEEGINCPTFYFLGLFYIALFSFGYLVYVSKERSVQIIFNHARNLGLYAMLVFAATPVLRSLTRSYSTDTVWTLAFLCALLHLYMFDYKYFANPLSTSLECTLSRSSAFMLTLLLASRLESNLYVFFYLSFSGIVFSLVPQCWHTLKKRNSILYIVFLSIFVLDLFLVLPTPWNAAYVAFVVLVLVLLPLLLILLLAYTKSNRYGPWDPLKIIHE